MDQVPVTRRNGTRQIRYQQVDPPALASFGGNVVHVSRSLLAAEILLIQTGCREQMRESGARKPGCKLCQRLETLRCGTCALRDPLRAGSESMMLSETHYVYPSHYSASELATGVVADCGSMHFYQSVPANRSLFPGS
jgi:hypothetical protein